jgi:DNA-directed RNA polymerase beta subunit
MVICPIETPEGQNVGLNAPLTTCARVNLDSVRTIQGVINGKVIKTGQTTVFTADIEDFYKIAPAKNSKKCRLQAVIIVTGQKSISALSVFKSFLAT